MKKINTQLVVFAVIILSLTVFWWINTQENRTSINEYIIDQSDFVNGNELIKDISESQLSEEEIAGLVLMREEEKLARDVYITLGEKWGIRIFTNIANSEQTHTDAVKVLLDRYDLEDPVKDDSIGVFTSTLLDELYDSLIEQGFSSPLDALIVGAIVEDLDLYDLSELLAETDNADIIVTYNNLSKGSRNHLRAFFEQIVNNDGLYSPQFITQAEFDEVISSEQERGQVG